MKKIFAFAVLFAAISMVACGGQQKAEDKDKEAAKTECCGECESKTECCGDECCGDECCDEKAECCGEKAECDGEKCCDECEK